jgi:hypothetical protein
MALIAFWWWPFSGAWHSASTADSKTLASSGSSRQSDSLHTAVGKPVSDANTDAAAEYLFDSNRLSGALLFSKGRVKKFVPESGAPSGRDLWVRDASGSQRLINPSVFSARFSPHGQRLAYTTSECALHVEDLQGNKLVEVTGAYSPRWKPDGTAIVFAKVPDGRDVHLPGTLSLATLDPASGNVALLTDGQFDDVRPEFAPTGDWILFVSGARTGLASFWRLGLDGNAGGPVQVTNLGQQDVDENFVPTPYYENGRQALWVSFLSHGCFCGLVWLGRGSRGRLLPRLRG